jgi:hypothetical protein
LHLEKTSQSKRPLSPQKKATLSQFKRAQVSQKR